MGVKRSRIFVFGIITGIYWFSLYSYVPTLSTYASSLGASYKLVGLIIGSYGFVQMLLRIPLGILSDKLNKRKLFVTLGLLLGLASSLGMWLFKSPEALLVFRSLAGAAAASWVTFTVLFSSYFEADESPKALGYINSFRVVGQVTATFLGGVAAKVYGQKAAFMLAYLAAAAGIIISAAVLEKRVDRKPLEIKALLSVGKEKSLLAFSILAIFIEFTIFSTLYGFTPVVAKQLGADDFQLGLLTTVSALPGILAAALSGSVLLKRFGARKTLMGGFILTALACALIPFSPSVLILYAIQIVTGFCTAAVSSLLMGLCIRSVDSERRATAMGFFQAIYGIGMFVGPAAVGFLGDTTGLASGFIAAGLVALLGAAGAARFAPGKLDAVA